MIPRPRLTALCLTAAAAFSPRAFAQCSSAWLDGWPTPALTLATGTPVIRGFHVYDPDADGPEPEHLIVAGQFDTIEGTPARGVAEWDGSRWTAPIANSNVLSLDAACMFQGSLIVGGQFSITGGANIARWTGSAWEPMGTSPNGRVRCLAVVNGEFYIGGDFTNAGGDPLADAFARWDGTQWRSVGGGLACTGCAAPFPVKALLPTPAGLVVAGDFETAGGLASPDIAVWDGNAWQSRAGLGNTGARVNAVVLHQGDLYAAGLFASGTTVARWNPATSDWAILPSQASSGEAFSLTSFGGDLYVGTNSPLINLVPIPTRVARWNGSAWSSAADAASLLVGVPNSVLALANYRGRFVAGGQNVGYRLTGDPNAAVRPCLLEYDGTNWETFAKGIDGAALDFERYQGDILLIGGFRVAGGRRVNGVTRWNGSTFLPMGAGLYSNTFTATGEIGSDLHYGPDDRLYAAGQFSVTDAGASIGGVAYWDGNAWRRTTASASQNPTGQMYDFCTFNDELYVSGNGSAPAGGRILRYTGTAWASTNWPLGTGPFCIEGAGTELLAGSYRYTGTSWLIANNAPQNMVKLRSISGRTLGLCDGGINGTTTCIGEYRNNAWVPIGSGITGAITQSLSGSVNMFHGDLIAARAFNVSAALARVARYDGVQWRILPGDPDTIPPGDSSAGTVVRASSTFVDGDTLWVSGVFLNAGGRPSPYLARYQASAPPVFTQPPAPQSVCAGQTAVFTAAATDGTLRWRRNGVPLVENQNLPGGGVATGVSTATLTITNPGPADSGSFDCLAITDCGHAQSAPAALDVRTCCDADFNADGNADQDDVACLVAAIAGDASCTTRDLDFNLDGNTDQDDLAALVNVIAGGPCP